VRYGTEEEVWRRRGQAEDDKSSRKVQVVSCPCNGDNVSIFLPILRSKLALHNGFVFLTLYIREVSRSHVPEYPQQNKCFIPEEQGRVDDCQPVED